MHARDANFAVMSDRAGPQVEFTIYLTALFNGRSTHIALCPSSWDSS